MPYATLEDLEDRYGKLSEEEEDAATAMINDASSIIAALVPDSKETDAGLLTMVCCAMVRRALTSLSSDAYGVTQQSFTAGPYTQSVTMSNPSADLYLTRTEKALLGIGRQGARSIHAEARSPRGVPPWER